MPPPPETALFLADESLRSAIVSGFRVRRPDIAFVSAREAGLLTHPDEDYLRYGSLHGLVLVSEDCSTAPPLAYDFASRGGACPGVVIVASTMPVGRAIDGLVLLADLATPVDWSQIVVWLR